MYESPVYQAAIC